MSFLPAGLIGLVIAAVFSAAMSSVSSELNALASTSVIDVYKRLVRPDESDSHYVRASKFATLFWGIFAIGFALTAHRFAPSLIELVNMIGSLFYGTILGMFLLAFYAKNMSGTSTFTGALVAEAVVVYCKLGTDIAYLWFNVIGCLVTIGVALLVEALSRSPRTDTR
jgi:Na+/proline symporter